MNNPNAISTAQRQQRNGIRNGYLCESVETLKSAQERQDDYGKACLQEMIDQCEKEGVDNFGDTTL